MELSTLKNIQKNTANYEAMNLHQARFVLRVIYDIVCNIIKQQEDKNVNCKS